MAGAIVHALARRDKVRAKEERGQTDAEEVHRRADDDLIGFDRDREGSEEQRREKACRHRRAKAKRKNPGRIGRRKSGKGSHQHDAFDADVDDARTLADRLARRGENQQRRKPPGRAEDRREES